MTELKQIDRDIISILESGLVSQTGLRRVYGGSKDAIASSVRRLLDAGLIERRGTGALTLLALVDSSRAGSPSLDESSEPPDPPAREHSDRVRLVEELLEIERLTVEMASRRATILESLRA